jgi:hypothetical protein
MLVSELIKNLRQYKKMFGDGDVYLVQYGEGHTKAYICSALLESESVGGVVILDTEAANEHKLIKPELEALQ